MNALIDAMNNYYTNNSISSSLYGSDDIDPQARIVDQDDNTSAWHVFGPNPSATDFSVYAIF